MKLEYGNIYLYLKRKAFEALENCSFDGVNKLFFESAEKHQYSDLDKGTLLVWPPSSYE